MTVITIFTYHADILLLDLCDGDVWAVFMLYKIGMMQIGESYLGSYINRG